MIILVLSYTLVKHCEYCLTEALGLRNGWWLRGICCFWSAQNLKAIRVEYFVKLC